MDLAFDFHELTRQLVPGPEGIELRIWAEFTVTARGERVIQDDLFPVLEFAFASQNWIQAVQTAPEDFVFEERISIHRHGKVWRLKDDMFPLEAIVEALDLFYLKLREAVSAEFGIDLDAFAARGDRMPRSRLQ